ncbi:hypothetical protein HY968_02080 [Candidatus Kaiserbacteria bacterium]|nr:hypothetical protein [Candidatus Kaiserbacteria bacterium]
MKVFRIILPGIVFLLPAVAAAQGAPQTLGELATLVVKLISAATVVLIAFAIVVYFYGIFYNMSTFTEGSPEKLRAYFFWGIIALFIMVSIWGILSLLSQTVFNGNPPGTING